MNKIQIECTEKTNAIIALGEELKAKEQECEALKKRNEDNERFYLKQFAKKDSEVLDLTHKLNVKTQECEELKQYQEDAEKVLKNILDNFDKMENRYREALEEIEEIVNEPCVAYVHEDCKHCDDWCEHKDILEIINKAKGEGNEQL